MAERWVLNASPAIILARIGQENLLFELPDQVVIPRAVAAEIQAGPVEDQARQALEAGRFTIVDTPPPSATLLAWDLGAGETAVLSFAIAEAGWTAILDDAAARRCARSFALPIKGTLGINLLAKKQGLLASATDVLKSLQAIGFRLDDQIIAEALRHVVDEDWPT